MKGFFLACIVLATFGSCARAIEIDKKLDRIESMMINLQVNK